MKYRKKPVVVEAFNQNQEETPDWFIEAIISGAIKYITVASGIKVLIKTLEGPMLADSNDYIIKGVNGEFYSCKPNVFEKTYEPVTNE
ncbi:hypothetical protein Cpap_1462 [Ruminiclostridium papyrosolvens DSM 2782]|uniref:Phage protein n=1 Tax=Ruminiclostridium papyrosolvens DSM 2782 TaxID=588581 RepID=F1TEA4_9FIRM|nr:hypothetical protein [Ruminiclostridium papyrosolvens]EGD47070.1 hypothetical protein Cpap_1462 [Ruminiclostridium papyrosolvens DSM 2782]WES36011.1 hypothetical protein P0092_08635 [Ruminiclostridium papyrosolvens DSM 2782]WES36109.1 hypothetical protein P0092_09135 [Ruminiclostridium papyrosolvens DSM 2782]